MPKAIRRDRGDYWITLLRKEARALREGGVLSFKVSAAGDVEVTLAPYEAPIQAGKQSDDEREEHPDPLLDPATYGRSGSLPGFQRPEDDPDDDYDDAEPPEFGS